VEAFLAFLGVEGIKAVPEGGVGEDEAERLTYLVSRHIVFSRDRLTGMACKRKVYGLQNICYRWL
jgi:hypothetical protein